MKAFPLTKDMVLGAVSHVDAQGMDLRDYFAAKAMEGMLLKHVITEVDSRQKIAAAAFRMADTMMEARNAAQ